MKGHVVFNRLSRFRRTDQLGHRLMSGPDLAIVQNENVAAPMDLMSGEAGKPYPEGDQIAQGNQPEVSQDGAIVNNACYA